MILDKKIPIVETLSGPSAFTLSRALIVSKSSNERSTDVLTLRDLEALGKARLRYRKSA